MHTLLKYFLGVICLLVGFKLTLKAQTKDTVILEKTNSLLWKITGNQMKQPSYLFGTMHLICKEDYIWTAAMEKAFQASNELCLEMDMDDPMVMLQIAQGMVDASGKSLSEYFSTEDYSLVQQYFYNKLQLSNTILASLKPTALMILMATDGITCSEKLSYETELMQEAQKLKMNIVGLETPHEQLKLLENAPADSIVAAILKMIKTPKSTDDNDYPALVAAYKKQNISKLYMLIKNSEQNNISLNAFLDERNMKWIERMEERMDQRPTFFAVGAGHLWGINGLIQLLKEKGYKVTPMLK